MTAALAAVLLLVLGVLVWRAVTRDRRDYARFKELTATADRRRVLRRWAIESWAVLGGMSLVVLLAAGPFVGAVLADAGGWGVFGMLPPDARLGIVTGVVLAAVVALVLPIVLLRGRIDEVPTLGDVSALLPRSRGELGVGAVLAITAGIVEEALFRLALPALLFGILPNGPVAFAAAAVVFGLLHIYQGPAGIAATLVMGLLLSALYVLSGSILLVMALHALFDLRSLVLIPVLLRGAWRTPDTPAAG